MPSVQNWKAQDHFSQSTELTGITNYRYNINSTPKSPTSWWLLEPNHQTQHLVFEVSERGLTDSVSQTPGGWPTVKWKRREITSLMIGSSLILRWVSSESFSSFMMDERGWTALFNFTKLSLTLWKKPNRDKVQSGNRLPIIGCEFSNLKQRLYTLKNVSRKSRFCVFPLHHIRVKGRFRGSGDSDMTKISIWHSLTLSTRIPRPSRIDLTSFRWCSRNFACLAWSLLKKPLLDSRARWGVRCQRRDLIQYDIDRNNTMPKWSNCYSLYRLFYQVSISQVKGYGWLHHWCWQLEEFYYSRRCQIACAESWT